MKKVFILQHERPETEEVWEDIKLIGAFSSEAKAQAAIDRLRLQPGFQDYPDGFSIDEFAIDNGSWEEGLIVAGSREKKGRR